MDNLNPMDMRPKSSGSDTTQPFDVVQLPSKGLLYRTGPLAGKETIEIYYLTAAHEDILTSPNLLATGKMIELLLKAVIKNRDINSEDLVLGDRNAILVWLRSTGYGSEYPVRIRCRSCLETYDHEFDLSELNLKFLETTPDENGLFSTVLPVSKKTVKFSLMTGREENELNDILEKKKSKIGSPISNATTLKISKLIKEVDGSSDLTLIRNFVSNMSAKDSREFRKVVMDIEPGVILRQEAKCKLCGSISEEVVPINPNFFWPDIQL